MQDFFFLSLSILVTFFVAFTWTILNQTLTPFQSGFNITITCTYPDVDATLYCQLVGILLYLTHTCHDLPFVVGLLS
jgi:hypothetical protein